MRRTLLLAIVFAGAFAGGCTSGPTVAHNLVGSDLPLRRIADVPLPGRPNRLDYQSLDATRHRLFIAHMGDSSVVVVDTQRRRVIAEIPGIGTVTGILAVPERHTVYASATASNELVAIDEDTLRIVSRTPAGDFPDGISFDPVEQRLYVSDERGGTLTVIDVRTARRIATIALGGEVGNNQYDPVSRHIFANVQARGVLVEIDPRTNAVVKRFPTTGCVGNHGLLIDARARRAFVACEDNGAFLWFDMRTMKIEGTWQVGADPDVLALDTKTRRLYLAAESGIVSIFDVGATVRRLAQGYLAAGAHTVAVDSANGQVYFPLANVDGTPLLRIMQPR